MQYLKELGSPYLRRLQNIAGYRCFAKRLVPKISVHEATADNMLAIVHWLTPNEDPTQVIQHDPDVSNWVAEHHGLPVGFVQLVHRPPDYFPYDGFWLFSLMVRTAWRGAGIGECLSQKVIERAKLEGALILNLLVYEDNYRAVGLYQKLGFKIHAIPDLEIQLNQEYIETGRRRILMQKQLDDPV
jgi:ribosomal protein S18 acetylase RimI-like enzyme